MHLRSAIRMISLLLVLTTGIAAVDLETAWQNYLETSSEIAVLQTEKTAYTTEQLNLRPEVSRLQQSSTWYNAWLNKLLLSGYSQRQLVLIDSLRSVDVRLAVLLSRQKQDQLELKTAYKQILKASAMMGSLSSDDRETALKVGRWFMDQPADQPHLPDYSDLVNADYGSPELRQLVLVDIEQLLHQKLIQLDSLMQLIAEEQQLASRLAEFHEDLGLQMVADQDGQARDESGAPEPVFAWGAAAEATDNYVGLASARVSSPAPDAINLKLRNSDDRPGLPLTGSNGRLDNLRAKQLEYAALLELINTELTQTH
ncbi:MAG: hypothetical protein L3J79_02035 [Candidatus Marinimicrobia bacterium]|nr:hypothetical protein [Candidatus Neomarinimicrobiota bacterium]